MAEITEPWADPDDEYQALVDLVVPAAQSQYDHAVHGWASLDAKAFGFLALVAAVIGGLLTFHESINRAWWGVAVGFTAAGGCFLGSLWPREYELGPDLIDFHDEARLGTPLDAAREMLEQLTSAEESVEEKYADKSRWFTRGLALFAVSVVACIPVLAFRP